MNDHDLLIEINVLVKQMLQVSERDRTESALRDSKTNDRIKLVEDDVSGLKTSRAQLMAIVAAISTGIGLLIRFFWK